MNEPHALNCPSCTASFQYDGRSETVRCEYCGTTIIVPESFKSGASQPGVFGDEQQNIRHILELAQQGQKIEAIKLYREMFGGSLKEAKEAVEQLAYGRPTAVISTAGVGAAVATTTAASTGCGCILPMIIMLVVLGVGAAIFYTQSPEQFDSIIAAVTEGDIEKAAEEVSGVVANANRAVNGRVVATTNGGDGAAPDLLLETWEYGGSDIPVMLSYMAEQDGARQIVWEQQIGDTSTGSQYNVAFDKQRVYLSQDTSLQAFNRDDGTPLWETVLSDKVTVQCDSCIRSVKDRVIVLTADNVLEAFDTNSGRSAWQVRLKNQYFSHPDAGQVAFAVVGDWAMVLDRVEVDGLSESGLYFYDIEDGELVQELVPRCPDVEQFFPDDFLSDDGQIFINEQTGELITLFGTSFVRQMCLQKWDVSSGEMVWETRLPEGVGGYHSVGKGILPVDSFSPFAVYTSDTLLATLDINPEYSTGGVMQFDLTDGRILFQISDPDNELTPIGRQGDVALLLAEKQRGSSQREIWGVDTNTGERLWRHVIQAEYVYELEPFDDKFSYRLRPDGLVVMQLLTDADPANLVVQKLNIADGDLLYDVKNPVGDDYWSGLAWASDDAYLILRALVAVDLQVGTAVQDWP